MTKPTWRSDAQLNRQIDRWRAWGALDDTGWRRARAILGPWPSTAQWRSFLDHVSLWLGAGLLGAAAICFVAANWDALDRFGRLAGLQLALVLASLVAWRLTLARPAGQAMLLLAALLLGGVLALAGQTYQTGADTWQLFALWAALLLPWLFAAASTAMSLLWAVVANVALMLFVRERLDDPMLTWLAMGGFDLLLWLAWEATADQVPGMRGRTGPRLLAGAALAWLTAAALADLFEMGPTAGLGLLPWCGGMIVTTVLSWRRHRDIALLASAALAAIVVITAGAARLLFDLADADVGGVLLLALLVIAQAAAASAGLRRLAVRNASP